MLTHLALLGYFISIHLVVRSITIVIIEVFFETIFAWTTSERAYKLGSVSKEFFG